MHDEQGQFILELSTRQGRLSERFATYEEARKRLEQFPADSLVGLAFIFQELADGSERVVREDGKPLQFHRRLVEESAASSDEPLPLAEENPPDLGPEAKIRVVEPEEKTPFF
jgi:hypothetical protein